MLNTHKTLSARPSIKGLRAPAVLFAVLLVVAGCKKGQGMGPSAPPLPNTGPHSIMEFEVWRGDPSCFSGCPEEEPHLLVQGTEAGSFSASSTTNSGHDLSVRVTFPVIPGRLVKLTVVNDADFWEGSRIRTLEGVTRDRRGFLTLGGNFTTRSVPGIYTITIRVEETGPDLSQPFILEAVVLLTLT